MKQLRSGSKDACWEEYFSNPNSFWDNRLNKRNSRAPDFRHKVTRQALWVDGWYTPEWIKERLRYGGDGVNACVPLVCSKMR